MPERAAPGVILRVLHLWNHQAELGARNDRIGHQPLVDRIHAVLEQRSKQTNSLLHNPSIG